MNLTNEQIDALIEALNAQKKSEPKVCWLVLDKDGDYNDKSFEEGEAREILRQANCSGSFKPYTLYRCVEVTE